MLTIEPNLSLSLLQPNVAIAVRCLERRMEVVANPELAAEIARNHPTFFDDPPGRLRYAVAQALINRLWN